MKKYQNKLLALQKRNIANLDNLKAGSSTIAGPDTTSTSISTSVTQSSTDCTALTPALTIAFTTTATGTN